MFSRWTWMMFVMISGLMAPLVLAQDESEPPPPISADRPGAGNGTSLVGVGFVQLETGWDRATFDAPGGDLVADAYGNTLLRTGLTDQFELRMAWRGYQRIETGLADPNDERSGIGDLNAGVRMKLRDGRNGGPAIAMDVTTSIPAGDDEVSSDRYDPGINFSLDQGLGNYLGLNVNAGASWFEQEGVQETSRVSNGFYSVSLGFSLGGGFGGYLEYFGEEPLSAQGSGNQAFDGGFTWTPANHWQLDIFYGQDADNSEDTFMGAGVAVRFPN